MNIPPLPPYVIKRVLLSMHIHSSVRRTCNNDVIYCYPLTYYKYKLCKAQPHDLAILAPSFLFSIYPRIPQTTPISHPCDPIHNTLLKETIGNFATHRHNVHQTTTLFAGHMVYRMLYRFWETHNVFHNSPQLFTNTDT